MSVIVANKLKGLIELLEKAQVVMDFRLVINNVSEDVREADKFLNKNPADESVWYSFEVSGRFKEKT